jgi:hypothetical protein
MELHRTLVMEIEKFEVWERPWSFYKALSTSPCLDEDASELLNIVWAAHWRTLALSTVSLGF